jgi:hypothetical protein
MDSAYCATGPNRAWWTSDAGDELLAAAELCRTRCPVLQQCRAWSGRRKWAPGIAIAGRVVLGRAPRRTTSTPPLPPPVSDHDRSTS